MNMPIAAALGCACVLLSSPAAAGDEAGTPMIYDLVVETGMPHLEENLRYAVTRERRCVDQADLGGMFPVLGHVSLQDCHLARTDQRAGEASYELVCTGGHGTTGEAHWQFGERSLAGTLNVKLGGKNMTFYQRISGRALGRCTAP